MENIPWFTDLVLGSPWLWVGAAIGYAIGYKHCKKKAEAHTAEVVARWKDDISQLGGRALWEKAEMRDHGRKLDKVLSKRWS